MTEAEKEIRAVMAGWLEASSRGDLEQIAALMTEDVLFLTSSQPPMSKAQFMALSQANLGRFEMEAVQETQEVQVSGDWAYARTHLRVEVRLEAGGTMVRSGPVLSVFRRTGQGWQLHRDANMLTVER